MSYFSDVLGLVTKSDPTTENGGTFLCHVTVISDMLNLFPYSKDSLPYTKNFLTMLFCRKMSNARVSSGLYLRSAHHTKRTVSHDELTSFFVTSYLLETNHRNTIWNYMKKHFGVYSVPGGERKLPFQPACYYPWARLADSRVSLLFFPFYVLAFTVAMIKDRSHTSSRLLYMDELYAMNKKGHFLDKLLYKAYVWKMKRMYGEKYVKGLTDIYFGAEELNHPVRLLASMV